MILTIIVPVYKVESYIRKCLNSLLLPKEYLGSVEVLIINDGSPDKSAEISREYVSRCPGLFRQIDKENGGHGSVWNLGVKEASGKYVKFLDSDDWLENVDLMVKKLLKTDVDLIVAPTITHSANDELWKLEIKDMEFDRVYDADKFDWLGNHSHKNFIFHHCAIYRTSMLRQYMPLFLENQPYDDTVLGVAPIIGAKSLVAWDFVVYHYLMDRPGQSISTTTQIRNVEAKLRAVQSTVDFIESHPIENKGSSKIEYFRNRLPKYYSFGYKSLFKLLPREEVSPYVRSWDAWVGKRNRGIRTFWMLLYRSLPFRLYGLCFDAYMLIVKIIK